MPESSSTLVLNFIDYEQAFDPADRGGLTKAISLQYIPYKYIKMISTVYENNIAMAKVGNKVSSWFHIEPGAEQSCVLSLRK